VADPSENIKEEDMAQKRLSMRKIAEILRLKYEMKLSHRQIGQSCGVSASTVGEYVTHAKAAGISWPLPEGLKEEALEALLYPKQAGGSSRQIPLPEWAKVHKELRRKGVTLSLLWIEYRREHPEGYGYSQYCYHYQAWSKRLKLMMRQKHRGGEKLFIDYAGQTMPVVDATTGEVRQVQIFVATWGASNYMYVEAHEAQSLPYWIGAHARALAFFGSVPEVLVPDNLKSGVKSPDRYEPDLNPTYQKFAEHYGVGVIPARSKKPKDKAKVETGVQVVERWILAPLRHHTFFSVAELNQAMKPLLDEVNNRPMKHLEASRYELFMELDQPAASPLPLEPYEYAHWQKARVHIDYHVAYAKHFYSVPYTLAGKEVDIRATEKTVEIFYDRQRQASHRRDNTPGRFSTLYEHMPPAHQAMSDWSPERFLRWAEEVGPQTTQLVGVVLEKRRHPQQAYRSCLGILGLAKRYTNQRLEAACERALAAGIHTYKGLHNILKNNLDQLQTEKATEIPLPSHDHIRGQTYYH
jgi:transposase